MKYRCWKPGKDLPADCIVCDGDAVFIAKPVCCSKSIGNVSLLAIIFIIGHGNSDAFQGNSERIVFDYEDLSGSLFYHRAVKEERASTATTANLSSPGYRELNLNFGGQSGQFHYNNAISTTDSMTQLGMSRRNMRVDLFRGRGDTVSNLRSVFSEVDQFHFHGGVPHRYNATGLSLAATFPGGGTMNMARAEIKAAGLDTRTVWELGYASSRLQLSFYSVYTANSHTGNAYSIGTKLKNSILRVKHSRHINGAQITGLNYRLNRNKLIFSADVQKSRNPLFEQKNDFRVVFGMGYQFGSAEGTNHSPSDYIAGAGVIAAGLLLSSGRSSAEGKSLSADNFVRSLTQNEAARKSLNDVNPVSIKQNREYGGYVFRNADGSYSSTEPIPGSTLNISLPDEMFITPSTSTTTAIYHTHGARGIETFSGLDFHWFRSSQLDGYVSTPRGSFQYYNLESNRVFDLGKVAN